MSCLHPTLLWKTQRGTYECLMDPCYALTKCMQYISEMKFNLIYLKWQLTMYPYMLLQNMSCGVYEISVIPNLQVRFDFQCVLNETKRRPTSPCLFTFIPHASTAWSPSEFSGLYTFISCTYFSGFLSRVEDNTCELRACSLSTLPPLMPLWHYCPSIKFFIPSSVQIQFPSLHEETWTTSGWSYYRS